jgi:hypothetical protein
VMPKRAVSAKGSVQSIGTKLEQTRPTEQLFV